MIYLKSFYRLVAVLIIATLIPSSNLLAAVLNPSFVNSEDERKVEQDREQALMSALGQVDPSLIKRDDVEVTKVPAAESAEIQREVKRLREARKNQFKHLTWTHIKNMITEESVLARMQFLEEHDKSLKDVIERSIQVHIPAQIAKERITLAKFRIAKAIRDLFPEMSLEGNVEHGSLSASAFVSDRWRIKMKQPLFRGGVLWNTMLLEWTNLEVARREYDKTISDLIAEVSEAYFEYERARNHMQDQQEFFELAKAQKELSDKKYNANLISEIEKLNVDSLFSQAQYDLETAMQELEIAKLDLQKFLNLEIGEPIDVSALYEIQNLSPDMIKESIQKGNPLGSESLNANLDEFIDLSYENRPDLQVEASKLKATHYAYRVALGKSLPTADMIIEFGELAEAFIADTRDPGHNTEFRLAFEVAWPLGGNTLKYTYDHDQRAPSVSQFQSQAGTRKLSNSFSIGILDDMEQFTNIQEAKISSLEQVVEIEKTERDVLREVKEAYYNFNKSLIQVESAYKRMDYRNRLARVSKHRLENNEIQVSEYLQAEMSYVEERGLVYKALADFFLSKAKLNQAIGIRDYLLIETL